MAENQVPQSIISLCAMQETCVRLLQRNDPEDMWWFEYNMNARVGCMVYLGGCENSRMWGLARGNGSLKVCLWQVYLGPSFLLPDNHEVRWVAAIKGSLYSNSLLHQGSTVTPPRDHRRHPQKSWAKISLGCFRQTFCHRNSRIRDPGPSLKPRENYTGHPHIT